MKLKNKANSLKIWGAIFILISHISLSTSLQANIRADNDVVICSNNISKHTIPDFKSTDCSTQPFQNLNPTNTLLWVKTSITVSQKFLNNTPAIGLYISGKTSSEVYFNGTFVGSNGLPAQNKTAEKPGAMDAVFFIPRHTIKQGSNDIMLKMSGHNGFLNLIRPIHWLGLAHYAQPNNLQLRHYWKSIIPFGLLLLGTVYFGIASFKQKEHLLLSLMSCFASAQLFIEITRGLIAYPYPFHDIRLVLILLFSFCFGMTMLLYTLNSLNYKRLISIFFVSASVLTLTIFVTKGFDSKSAIALGFPTLVSLGLAIYSHYQKQVRATGLVVSLSLFAIAIIVAPNKFLDIYLFYIVAAFLIVLFIQQLAALENETQARAEEKERADKLQLIIDQNSLGNDNHTLYIKSANKTEIVSIADIAFFQGAGDYIEVALTDNTTLLHNDNLTTLENNLPSTFLRVHRSFIVNTSMISSLERKKSGVGVLTLKNNKTVPVSRRIMPSVREKIL